MAVRIDDNYGSTSAVLDQVRAWLGRFLAVVNDSDLDLLALWAAHTHLVRETYSTPRLLIDSPAPGSGKTTCLEHLARLSLAPVQMASVSSPAMLARLLDVSLRTILIDEADRALRPEKEGVADLLAIINSGYKTGGTRPVLVPDKDSGWTVKEMTTFAPVALAGNSTHLPEDTRSRTIRVLLLPDLNGTVEESDWEILDADAAELGQRLAAWADEIRDQVAGHRPPMPAGITGRFREKWQPLARVAAAAGGRWPDVVDALAIADKAQVQADKEDGLITERPHLVLLRDLATIWPDGATFTPTSTLVDSLIYHNPEAWGPESPYGKALTAKRLGKMLATNYKINSSFVGTSHTGPRGYRRADLELVWTRMGTLLAPEDASTLPEEASHPSEPSYPSHEDRTDRQLRTLGTDSEGGGTEASRPPCTLHGTRSTAGCYSCEQFANGARACRECGLPLDPDEAAAGEDTCGDCRLQIGA